MDEYSLLYYIDDNITLIWSDYNSGWGWFLEVNFITP